MKRLYLLLLILTGIIISSCTDQSVISSDDVIIENDEIKLVISKDGIAKSLVYKPGNTECLIQGKKVPVSTITEPRPYQNEVKLAYPNKKTTFKSNSVRKEGDKLIIGYELIPWEATVV